MHEELGYKPTTRPGWWERFFTSLFVLTVITLLTTFIFVAGMYIINTVTPTFIVKTIGVAIIVTLLAVIAATITGEK